jgi:hypothetical protein
LHQRMKKTTFCYIYCQFAPRPSQKKGMKPFVYKVIDNFSGWGRAYTIL